VNTLLDLVHHNIEIDILKVQAKGELLNSLPDDGDVEGLKGAFPRHHAHEYLLLDSAHSNIIAFD
jgi:hypothetical protein